MPEMPRYGVRFRLPERMDAFAYFGRGPEENYWDRKAGTFVGRYETSARRECFPYVRPQETGHHCDTEWIDFGELLIVADSSMEFNALRCTGRGSRRRTGRRPRLPVAQLDEKRLQRGGQGA